MKVTENYVFFWGGVFSNWYTSPIKLENTSIVNMDGNEENVVFPTSEHYFMYLKAMAFGDNDSAWKIIHTETPKEAKKLGRGVKGFNDAEWELLREPKMLIALRAKFSQNPELKKELLSPKYKGKHFVEASPYDKIWGIGKGEEDPTLLETTEWGLNLLGRCLDKIREEFEDE